MMHHINYIKAIVEGMLNRRGVSRWGLVQSVNPNDATATVLLQPDGVLTGWLPIKCMAAGPVNVVALPSPGDQVQVHSDTGDAEHGVISMASHGGSRTPPISPITSKPAQSGEYLVQLGAGAYIHVKGKNVYLGGDLYVSGSLKVGGNATPGTGASGSFTTPTGQTVTVRDGVVTNIF